MQRQLSSLNSELSHLSFKYTDSYFYNGFYYTIHGTCIKWRSWDSDFPGEYTYVINDHSRSCTKIIYDYILHKHTVWSYNFIVATTTKSCIWSQMSNRQENSSSRLWIKEFNAIPYSITAAFYTIILQDKEGDFLKLHTYVN